MRAFAIWPRATRSSLVSRRKSSPRPASTRAGRRFPRHDDFDDFSLPRATDAVAAGRRPPPRDAQAIRRAAGHGRILIISHIFYQRGWAAEYQHRAYGHFSKAARLGHMPAFQSRSRVRISSCISGHAGRYDLIAAAARAADDAIYDFR